MRRRWAVQAYSKGPDISKWGREGDEATLGSFSIYPLKGYCASWHQALEYSIWEINRLSQINRFWDCYSEEKAERSAHFPHWYSVLHRSWGAVQTIWWEVRRMGCWSGALYDALEATTIQWHLGGTDHGSYPLRLGRVPRYKSKYVGR